MSNVEPHLKTIATPNQVIEEDSIDLAEYVGVLYENRWLIAWVMLAFFLFALMYSFIATPIYRADALLQVEEQSPGLQGVDELEALMGSGSSSTVTEIEIIKSRKVIGEMVDAMNLTIGVAPQYFPLIGRRIASSYVGLEPASPWLWFESYAWGGEKVKVDRFDIPADFIGMSFTLVKGSGEHFSLLLGDEVVLNGNVGRAAMSKDGQVQLFISQLNAREATHFKLIKHSRALLIQEYQNVLKVSEKGRKTGIMELSLEGADRAEITTVLKEITDSYLKQNVRRHSEESQQMLTFISSQLPDLKGALSVAESTLNEYREKRGTIDISYESQSLIQRIADVEKAISELNIEKAELSNTLTLKHPLIQGINEKLAKLRETRQQFDAKVAKLPETELESVKFRRDVTVANELYMLLLNKSQELKVAKAGAIGNVRVIDEAFSSEKPVKPRKNLIIAVSLLLGLIAGVIVVSIKKALNKTIHDPKVIESMGLPVYAEIPFSEIQHDMDKKNTLNNKKSFTLLASLQKDVQTDERVVESLRSLRTSIQFAMMEANNNIIMISGPSPDIGKTFVSANFAYVMSDADKRVLLIDADMRKGHLSTYFNCDNEPGLSELIAGGISFDEVVRKNSQHNQTLDVVTSGAYPPNPSELLMSKAFEQFLKDAQTNYDLVIIDTPPILAVTDAAIIARYSDANFIVLRSEYHLPRDVEQTIKRFEQNGISLKGAIFNGVSLRNKGYGYGYKYYGYKYSYK